MQALLSAFANTHQLDKTLEDTYHHILRIMGAKGLFVNINEFSECYGSLSKEDKDSLVELIAKNTYKAPRTTEAPYNTRTVDDCTAFSQTNHLVPILNNLLIAPIHANNSSYVAWAYEDTQCHKPETLNTAQDIARLIAEKICSQAKSANNSKTDFLTAVSHELRTPINAILGISEILERSQSAAEDGLEESSDLIHTLKTSAQSLLSLVNDLLDISKIESNEITLENIPFDMHQLVAKAQSMMDVPANKKNLQLTTEITENVHTTYIGDPLRIRQLLINLLNNAINFTEEGSVKLEITTNETDNHVEINVIDTGIGMAPEHLEHIFNKFKQADGTITRKYGGSGLGLTITKDLVALMNGTITVESTLNVGSTFKLSIPLEKGDKTTVLVEESTIQTNDNQRRHILLVEDYEANILVATTILADMGFDITVAKNGQQGIDLIKDNTFDLVIMDVEMPIMDGLTATKTLREQYDNKLPIIGMTAHALAGDKEKCLNAGMNDYIAKPFNPQLLLEKINTLT